MCYNTDMLAITMHKIVLDKHGKPTYLCGGLGSGAFVNSNVNCENCIELLHE
jgi:hypothetical protein